MSPSFYNLGGLEIAELFFRMILDVINTSGKDIGIKIIHIDKWFIQHAKKKIIA